MDSWSSSIVIQISSKIIKGLHAERVPVELSSLSDVASLFIW